MTTPMGVARWWPEMYPPPAFYFSLCFDTSSGIADAAFQEASGLSLEMDEQSSREAGENRYAHQLPTGHKSLRLVLKRGVAPQDSGLVKWCKEVIEGDLGQPIKPRSFELYLLDAEGQVLRTWTFDNAWPASWSVAEFRAAKNDVALETVELSYGTALRKS